MESLTNKQAEALNSYTMKGFLFKPIPDLVIPLLQGACHGLLGFVNKDESVIVHSLVREEGIRTAKPLFKVKDGVVSKAIGKPLEVIPAKPEARSIGVYVSKSAKILVPLKV